jgi:predicted O-methyltransferase YrrM
MTSMHEQEIILEHAAIVKERGYRNILEIGTFRGHTSKALSINFPDMMITTLDIPKDALGILNDIMGERICYWKEHTQLTGSEPNVLQIPCDSALFKSLCDYGLIFIDGCHSYEYALADSLMALKCVESDGIILWHDYSSIYAHTVGKVVDMLRQTYPIQIIPDTKLAKLDMREVKGA